MCNTTYKTLKATTFVALFFILNALMNHVFLPYELRGYYAWLSQRFAARAAQAEIAVAGDSYAMVSLTDLDHSANDAGLAEGHIVTYYKLVHDLPRMPNVRTVILPLDRHSFSSARASQNDKPGGSRYINYFDLALHRGTVLENLSQYVRYKLFGYANAPVQVSQYLETEPFGLNHDRGDFQTAPNKAWLAQEAVVRNPPGDKGWDPEMVFFFERILRLCRDRGLTVVLIRFPISPEYFDAVEKRAPLAEFDKKAGEFLRNWPEIHVLDYQKIFFDRLELFADANHVNDKGAAEFSAIVARDLRALGLLSDASDTSDSSDESAGRW